MRRTYRQDRDSGQLYEVGAAPAGLSPESPAIAGPFQPFLSHVDGSWIDSPKSLEDHNRRNNVRPAAEFEGEIAARKKEREALFGGTGHDTDSRRESLLFAHDLHSAGRTKADTRQMIENFKQHHEDN